MLTILYRNEYAFPEEGGVEQAASLSMKKIGF